MNSAQQKVYRSRTASIEDVTANAGDAPIEIPLDQSCVAFIRSGYFAKPLNGAGVIIDANYVVFGEENGRLLSSGSSTQPHACTVLRYEGIPTDAPAGACALASSRAFLMHTRVLHDAQEGRRDFESDAIRLLFETQPPQNPYACAHSHMVNEMRRIVNESIPRHVSLMELASRLYISPFTVSRMFHRETGVSLREYALRLKLRKALDRIMHTRDSLTAIAFDLGFYDESHFSKAFRAQFDLSPRSVRRYGSFCRVGH